MAIPSRRPTQGMFVLRVTRAGEDETARYAIFRATDRLT
jgi:hypothetical protein